MHEGMYTDTIHIMSDRILLLLFLPSVSAAARTRRPYQTPSFIRDRYIKNKLHIFSRVYVHLSEYIYIYIILLYIHLYRAFLVTVRAGTAYREMKMWNVYFVCISIAVSYINHGVLGPPGTFSRETVRMYKDSGFQNIFQKC